MIFSEPHSTRQIENGLEWASGTTGELLAKTQDAPALDPAQVRALARRVRCPVLVIHGDEDRITPYADGVALAEDTGGRLVTLEGSGHVPNGRDPVPVNLHAARVPAAALAAGRVAPCPQPDAAGADGLLADRAGPRPARRGDRTRAPPPAAGSRDRLARTASDDVDAGGQRRARASGERASLPRSAPTSSRRRASTAWTCSMRTGAWTRSSSRTSCSSTRSRWTAATTSGSATRRGRSTTSCTRTRSSSALRTSGSPTSSGSCRCPRAASARRFSQPTTTPR